MPKAHKLATTIANTYRCGHGAGGTEVQLEAEERHRFERPVCGYWAKVAGNVRDEFIALKCVVACEALLLKFARGTRRVA